MTLQKIRANLAAQLDEQKRIADDESKERGFLLGKYRLVIQIISSFDSSHQIQ